MRSRPAGRNQEQEVKNRGYGPGKFKEDVAHGLYKQSPARGRWASP